MKETELEIYDVFEADSGNLFIKISNDYSIAIGSKGFHDPSNHWYELDVTQYVKINNICNVKKVGKLIFD